MNNIKVFKLITGEEIVSNVIEDSEVSSNSFDPFITLEHPILIKNGNLMGPWLSITSAEQIKIPMQSPLVTLPADEELIERYERHINFKL